MVIPRKLLFLTFPGHGNIEQESVLIKLFGNVVPVRECGRYCAMTLRTVSGMKDLFS